jgi:hypothetical protein
LNGSYFFNAKAYGIIVERDNGLIVSFLNAETFNKDVNDITVEHKGSKPQLIRSTFD